MKNDLKRCCFCSSDLLPGCEYEQNQSLWLQLKSPKKCFALDTSEIPTHGILFGVAFVTIFNNLLSFKVPPPTLLSKADVEL